VADVVVDSVVAAAVEMDLPVEAVESSVDVVIEEARAVVVATEVPHVEPTEAMLVAHLSTPTTRMLSPAWENDLSGDVRSS
jgi:hypothetical protein